jgi:hypothetical protein
LSKKNVFHKASLLGKASFGRAVEQLPYSIHAIIKSLTDINHPVGKHLHGLEDKSIGHLLVLLVSSHEDKSKKGDR